MPIIVIVVTSPAAYFGRLSFHQGYDGVIRDAAALHAMIVNDIAKSLFFHAKQPTHGSIPIWGSKRICERLRGGEY